MSDLSQLLDSDPTVATAGTDMLADSIEQQGSAVVRADWRPPFPGTEAALAALAIDGRMASSNATAVGRMLAVRPHLVDVGVARDVFPDMTDRTFFHAGPPLEWERANGPMRGAIIGAMLYEGLAADPDDAAAKAAAGEIELSPCHHHKAVGPMAGVTSPSMPVAIVNDGAGDGVSYSTLNEGLGKVLRYGAFAPEVIDRLRWMDHVLGPVLGAALRASGPVDLQSLIAQALQMGDDGHNRNRAVTSLFLRGIGAALVDGADAPTDQRLEVFKFIDNNDHFMLNLVMAAGKLGSDAAANVPASSLVTVMARNGTDFGIRLSGTGDQWFSAPAPPVDGLYLGAFTEEDASPDIGDSTITETIGLGGFAMAAAPAIVGFVGGTAAGAVRRTLAMYEISMAEHPAYQIPMLEFRGTPTGIDAVRVVRTGVKPQINTGIAGKVPGTGMVGAGLVEAPMECFADAINALAQGLDS
ncbi:MAG: DUF1116 domain-containing protein [Acidimicrobiia bacterium]|nr:DUF1116 domain-containing protein [Acidimicrobiia bacterium]MDX2465705.1 DUF1116 domain-containing protein [Acidimicrobiia bacterium]